MKIFKEPPLEPLARFLRFNQGIRYIDKKRKLIIVDLGCGPEIPFYHFALKRGIKIKKYFAFDPLLSKKTISDWQDKREVILDSIPLKRKIPLPSSFADYVVSFASLEHFAYPQALLTEALRIIKKNGQIILTTPTPKAKKILSILSCLGLLSKREIDEHKNYFEEKSIRTLIKEENVRVIYHSFELGLNNLLVIEKLSDK